MDSISTIVSLINPFANYVNYIDSDFKKPLGNNKEDLKKLLGFYLGIFLTYVYDGYLKNTNEVRGFDEDKMKENLLSFGVIKKYNDRYYVWPESEEITSTSLSYPTIDEALEKIRNKLAHGDFVINKDTIMFTENNGVGKVDIDGLYEFAVLLAVEININSNYFAKVNESRDDFDYYEFVFKNKLIKDKSKYLKNTKMLKKEAWKIASKKPFNKKQIKRFKEEQKSFCQKNKISFDIKQYKKEDIPDKEKVELLLSKSKRLNQRYSDNLLGTKIYEMLHKEDNLNLIIGLFLNIKFLHYLSKNPDNSLEDFICSNLDLYYFFIRNVNEIIISNFLVAFYLHYQYPLEKYLTSYGSLNTSNIFEHKEFSFLNLDLHAFIDSNMEIDHFVEFDFNHQATEELIKRLAGIENHLNDYLTKHNLSLDKLELASEKEKDTINKLQTMAKDIKIELEKIGNIEIEKYLSFPPIVRRKIETNLNIIFHLRHAMSHGSVYISTISNNVDDCVITFIDKHEGKIRYQKDIKFKDFLVLFNELDIINVDNYLLDKNDDLGSSRILNK